MGYLKSIKMAFILFPILAFIFTGFFVIHQYHRYGAVNKFRVFIVYSFILYLMCIYFLVILPLPSIEYVRKLTTARIQLVPFNFITDFINNTSFRFNDLSTWIGIIKEPTFYTVALNILMFIPLGIYLRYYYKCNMKETLLYSFFISLFFELTQLSGLYFIYPRAYRVCDVDDLIINTLGGIIGYFIGGLFNRILPSRDKIDIDSYNDGMRVSGLRRICMFMLDILIVCIIMTILKIYNLSGYYNYILLVIYYILIPWIWKGKTIGSSYLNIRLEFRYNLLLGLIIRFIFYYIFYSKLLTISMDIIKYIDKLVLCDLSILRVFTTIMIFIIYIIVFIKIFFTGRVFYDKLIGQKYISNIKQNDM